MRTGPKLKGRQVEPPHGKRSLNQPENVLPVKMRGKAEAPTQGITRNHPNTSTATGKHQNPGTPVPNSYFANSRTEVHHKFAKAGRKHD